MSFTVLLEDKNLAQLLKHTEQVRFSQTDGNDLFCKDDKNPDKLEFSINANLWAILDKKDIKLPKEINNGRLSVELDNGHEDISSEKRQEVGAEKGSFTLAIRTGEEATKEDTAIVKESITQYVSCQPSFKESVQISSTDEDNEFVIKGSTEQLCRIFNHLKTDEFYQNSLATMKNYPPRQDQPTTGVDLQSPYNPNGAMGG